MMGSSTILPSSFFARDTRLVAKELVGAHLVHELPSGELLRSRIVETEAYRQHDPACHAYSLRDGVPEGSKARAAFLFEEPGLSYIYLCYGMYWLLNVVTEAKGRAGAVLIRAVEPLAGHDTMAKLRKMKATDFNLSNGPGKLTLALGISPKQHAARLTEPPLYFEAATSRRRRLFQSPRVGISAGRDHLWRYFDGNSSYVSRAKENSLARPIAK